MQHKKVVPMYRFDMLRAESWQANKASRSKNGNPYFNRQSGVGLRISKLITRSILSRNIKLLEQ